MKRASRGLVAAGSTLLFTLAACPDEDPSGAVAVPFELPDRYETGGAAMLLRLGDGTSTTSTSVHRSLSRLFEREVSIRGALMRAPTAEQITEADPRMGGSAVEQVRLLMDQLAAEDGRAFPPGTMTDTCGNKMIAAFLTPEYAAAVLPDTGVMARSSVMSPAALDWVPTCAADPSCDSVMEGVWDVSLTETRRDGMVDAVLQVYPSVSTPIATPYPAFLGHLTGFFLTTEGPGWVGVPLYAAAEKITLFLSALVELDASYVDPHYGDAREVYMFPHRARTVAAKDIGLTMLGDPLCDLDHAWHAGGTLPWGCKLDDGRDLPLQLDLDAPIATSLFERLMGSGTKTEPLERTADALAYQLGAFLACPTFSEARWVADGPVELMICPDGALEDCRGFHDMEQAGCDFGDDSLFPASSVSLGGLGGSTTLSVSPSDNPYDITGSGTLRVTGVTDDVISIYGNTGGVSGPGSTSDRANSHCGGTAVDFVFSSSGTLEIDVSGGRVLISRPAEHIY